MTQPPLPTPSEPQIPGEPRLGRGDFNVLHPGGKAGTRNDRRGKRRALISAPVRIRCLDVTAGGPDEICTTVDVSRNGILFVTSNPAFHRGMEVAVTFPYTKSPNVAVPEQPGSVVRASALSEDKVAIAIGFALGASGAQTVVPSFPQSPDRILPSPDEEPSRKQLILVVEGDATLRGSLKTYLSAEGYNVIAVDNAADAREALNVLTPALLIAQIEGEGLPGFDLCVHVKTTPRLKHIPVMLTTQSAYPSDYSSAHSLGAVVCLPKPFRQERLGHVVRLLVPPDPMDIHTAPPRTPDHTRRPKFTTDSQRGAFGRLRFL